jgi:two-component system sensor histidine kinase UhpB
MSGSTTINEYGIENGTGSAGAEPRRSGVVLALLRIPLFYKILIANAIIVALVVMAIVLAVYRLVGPPAQDVAGAIVLVAALGMLLSLAVNAAILRLALLPLERLEQTAIDVHSGVEGARADPTPLADRGFARLVETFNDMLDRTAAQRRRLREVNMRALDAAEDERKRIARELHDGTAQTLAALRVRLRLARTVDDASVRSLLLEEISEEIGAAIDEVRRMARGLRPPALDILGLAPAVESYARSVAEAGGLRLELAVEPVENALAPEAELAVYRIIQEALSNVVRHSGAETVYVGLARRNGAVEAVVQDDGSGFVLDSVMTTETGRGLGLFGMQERASYMGGTVHIETWPERGTRVLVVIPGVEDERVV